MPDSSRDSRTHIGRSVDRLINFSDAVVAVAVTLLALPLVDIAGPSGDQTLLDILGAHAGEIGAFLFTFYVVALMWLVHNRILNSITNYDGTLFWMNASWLVVIVLLPWISSMYGTGSGDYPSVGFAYWAALALVSSLTSLMSYHLRHHPELLADDAPRFTPAEQKRLAWRGPVLGAYFLIIGIVWLISPGIAAYLPFGIIPLSIWLRPARVPISKASQDAEAPEPQ
ncbi:MAG: TMEM175 family protein [bacterium]|nr:TMEM175 family protein [bacterium]